MAEVHLARVDLPLEASRLVAFKRMLPAIASAPTQLQMFFEEARVAVQISHYAVVNVYDFGLAEQRPYLAMEFVDGHDLRDLIETAVLSSQPIPWDCVLSIVSQVARALAHAHALTDTHGRPLEAVHRDVSPSNILVAHNGCIKLTDFGIARVAPQLPHDDTVAGAIKGKIRYMSPEQARAEPLDGRSDLFSLGTVLAEALSHRQLFKCTSDFERLQMVRRGTPPERQRLKESLPADLFYLVTKAMQKDREERFQTGDEMADAIDAVLHRRCPGLGPSHLRAYLETIFPGERDSLIERLRLQAPAFEDTSPRAQQVTVAESVASFKTILGGVRAPPSARRQPEIVEPSPLRSRAIDAVRSGRDEERPNTRVVPKKRRRSSMSNLGAGEVVVAAVSRRTGRSPFLWVALALLTGVVSWQGVQQRFGHQVVTPLSLLPWGLAAEPSRGAPKKLSANVDDAVAAKPSRIVVVSAPAGAQVVVDGTPRCTTPCTLRLHPMEPVSLEVSSAGYSPWHRELQLETLATNIVDVALVRSDCEGSPSRFQ
jgi:serine/threonine-protein kinase